MDTELFKTNAHGDIWQEPTLWDQGGPANVTRPAHTFERDDLLEDVWPSEECEECEVVMPFERWNAGYAICEDCDR